MKIAAIIVCAGQGKRFDRFHKKAIFPLGGKPLFYHSLSVFATIAEIKQIVLVLRKEHLSVAKKSVCALGNQRIFFVEGGKERNDSVCCGLKALRGDITHILIHDGARPFVSAALVKRLIKELRRFPAVICGLPCRDTVKEVHHGFIKKTLAREKIFLAQTPQGFKLDVIKKAFCSLRDKKVSDDAQVLEVTRKRVKIIEGESGNFKITYPEDIKLAEAILKLEADKRGTKRG
ncbi:MAG: 2-C-methyl-D-erythritol 4-phosphate cytidylyltransferase [Candidatus Omnitrophica bacterium]|nr:2-C-methyl-D-erythritol 4-phosphate cytidylyltransferase [Candidatus Omnitrophota bacterium]